MFPVNVGNELFPKPSNTKGIFGLKKSKAIQNSLTGRDCLQRVDGSRIFG
jgi:hypothetical protein